MRSTPASSGRVASMVVLMSLVLISLLAVSLGCSESSISRLSCCKVQPSFDGTEEIVCVCPDLKEMVLTPDSIPESVTSVSISKLSNLTIGGDSFYKLNSLIDLNLQDIGNVTVESSGLNLPGKNQLHRLTARKIEFFHIHTHALTGTWRDLEASRITFEDIKKLDIAPRGFSYATKRDGPTVVIRNVGNLALASEAFDARIRELQLEQVVMQECSERTFDNKIDSVKLKNVDIRELRKGCFHSVGELFDSPSSGVFIASSTLGTVHQKAFSGRFPNIKLQKNTMVENVTENGFQVEVKDFCIENSKIGTQSSESLSVTFMDTFSVKEVDIEHLRKGAFRGVKATPHRTPTGPTVSLDALVIENAEPGSLSFQRCLFVEASDLDIQSSDVERCPTEQWTRGLMGLDAQQKVFSDVYRLYSCLHDSNSPCDMDTKRWQTLSGEDSSCDYASGKEDEKIDGNAGDADDGQEKGANVDRDHGENSVPDQQGSLNKNETEENKSDTTDTSRTKGADETQIGQSQTEDEIRREADAAVEEETEMEEKKGTGKESDTSGGHPNDDRTSTREEDSDEGMTSAISPWPSFWPALLITISCSVVIVYGVWWRCARQEQTSHSNPNSQDDQAMMMHPLRVDNGAGSLQEEHAPLERNNDTDEVVN